MTEQEEELDLQYQVEVEHGRKAKATMDILNEFLLLERAKTIRAIENGNYSETKELENFACYLQTLKKFELNVETLMTTGEIAEKELNKNGK